MRKAYIPQHPTNKAWTKAPQVHTHFKSEQEAAKAIHATADSMRQVMPIAYGLVHYTLLECHDHLKTLPRYRHKVKAAFKQCTESFHAYEHALLYNDYEYFNVNQLSPESRRQYKDDLTDKEYFEMWLSYGAYAYDKYRNMALSLRHKYSLFLKSKGIPDHEEIAWACLGKVASKMAQQSYDQLLTQVEINWHLPRPLTERFYGCFSLDTFVRQWDRAVDMLFDNGKVRLTDDEERNLSYGIDNLYNAYSAQYLTQDNELNVLQDSEELFRTKGFHRKRMIEAAELNEKYKQAISDNLK